MQNRLVENSTSRVRMALFASLFLSLILLAVFAQPSISRATREAGNSKATKGQSTKQRPKRPEFVPGEILVRYRSEKVAERRPRTAMVQGAERAIQIQVEAFSGSHAVEGLRMARVAAQDTMQAIAALRSQPDVLYAEPNYILHKDTVPDDPRFPELYGLKNTGQSGGTPGADIDAEQAWSFSTGSRGIVVGVIDEGIDIDHTDLHANIWINPSEIPANGIDDDGNGFVDDINGWDFFHDDNSVFDGASDATNQTDAHGTHVAGTIGAGGNNGIGVVGVNWQISLMSLKFLGPDGGSSSDVIRAISYAKNVRDTWVDTNGDQGANVRVLSNSYGGGGFSQAFLDAIKAAGNSGILFVAAAGNDSTDNDLLPHYPSSYDAPNMVAVAATDRFDNLSSFSNFGANTVHLAAPGSSILSTTPNNTYGTLSGTSMATPHVSGGAALLCTLKPDVTVQQLKAVLFFNGDSDPFLAGKTSTERRLNVAGSLQALVEDATPPGAVAEFRVTSQSGRSLSLAWTAAGDDGPNGQASLYQVSFTDAETGATNLLQSISPAASGSPQTQNVKIPYRHTNGTITLREFDNAGNEGIPASLPISVSVLEGDPYATTLGPAAALSTGGTPLGLTFDDRYRENYTLPFSFPFFGQNYISVTVSTNGNLYFSLPPKRANGDADDVPGSSAGLAKLRMIAGLWDDLDLRTSSRADADIYVVQPDANRIIFRWQGVPCNYQGGVCTGGDPVNFEIELQSNGNIQARYGSGNTNLFPVVGISGGEPDPYVVPTHTSEDLPVNLTNAQSVTFVSADQPMVSSLSPPFAIAGGAEFTLTVDGINFESSSTVHFNGAARSTAFVSDIQLTATILAADIVQAGSYPITVFNSGLGSGISQPVAFAVIPTVTGTEPSIVASGDPGFILTVNGAGFEPGTVVRFNGENRPTAFVSSMELSASITASDIATAGVYLISVVTSPSAGSLTSNAANLMVTPTIANLTPETAVAGGPGFTLTIDGCCFESGTVVRWNGSDRSTTVVNSSRLIAQITAADIAVGGVFPIIVFIPGPGAGTSLISNFVVSNPVPTITTVSPDTGTVGGPAFTLTINGTNFVNGSIVRWNGSDRETTLVSSTQLAAQISGSDIGVPGSAIVTVFNSEPGGGESLAHNFLIKERTVRIISASAASGSMVSLPIQLEAQGNEILVEFSITYDTLLLSNPQVVLGNDAMGAQVFTNSSQLALGHIGVTVFLPYGETFAAGTRQILILSFTTAALSTQTTTQVDFGYEPFSPLVIDDDFFRLLTTFTGGTVTITHGYEADVAPRPNGSNTGIIGISDWTQAGRFAAGLDLVDAGSEFQRADCSPRDTLGNGVISLADWVQAGRYAAGLDSVVPAGGPTGPTGPTSPAVARIENESLRTHGAIAAETTPAETIVNLVGSILPADQSSTVSIEFDAQGNENAFGFSLMFDPAKLSFVSAEKSSEAGAATLNLNMLDAAKGRLGIALALPSGSTFASGRHQLVVLTFALCSDSNELPSVSFTDLPIAREVVNLTAGRLDALFRSGAEADPLENAQFFVNQHYLDFLDRTPDIGGLDYWTQQINECGNDRLCVNQRRIGVSAAFFVEAEFQATGSFVYRLYKAGLGRQPSYAEFAADRGQVSGGANLNASKLAFAEAFVQRPEFVQYYQQHPTAATFTDHLLKQLRETSQVDLSLRRSELMALYLTGSSTSQSRSRVLQAIVDDTSFKHAEYNSSFVLMEYFGYLRREPDKAGYDFWLNVLNNREPGNYRGMVCSFITSTEYQRRFSYAVSYTNADCSH